MKKLLMGSAVLTIFAIAITIFQMSCTKDTHAEGPHLSKEKVLTRKEWRIDEIHRVVDGTYSSFSRGGANTTGIDFGKIRYTFNPDGTGTYTNELGATYPATWQFTTTDKRSIKFSISNLVPDQWQIVEICENYLHATENFTTKASTENLHSFRLIQLP